jgi:hypothetical protein
MSIYRCTDCYYFSPKVNEILETVYEDNRCLVHKCIVEKPHVTWCVDFKHKSDKDV